MPPSARASARAPFADPGFIDAHPRFPLPAPDPTLTAFLYCRTTTDYDDAQRDRVMVALAAAASRLRITLPTTGAAAAALTSAQITQITDEFQAAAARIQQLINSTSSKGPQ